MNTIVTVPGFDSFTAQHVFDTAARHLLSQKKRAYGKKENGGHSCLYNGPDGTSCAAGVFIEPQYRAAADKHGSWGGVVGAGMASRANYDLIRNLQIIHDDALDEWSHAVTVAFWSGELRSLAESYRLNEDAIDEMLTGS